MKKANFASNFAWKFAERTAAQLVTFAISVYLARLLSPEDYGVISIVTIIITLANLFVTDGFGTALIQKKDADEVDFSSVLFFSIGFSVILYALLFALAPWISAIYGEGYEILTPVLRVLGIRVILSGVNSIQHAYISKRMEFKKFFWATLTGTLLSAIVGIAMALKGLGVWALVGQYLTNTTVNTIVSFFVAKLKIVPSFSFVRLQQLLQYGYKILLSKLLISGFEELRALIIGKLYSSADLAFYNRGKQLPNLIVTNVDTSIGAVLFPIMSDKQENIDSVKHYTRQSIRLSSYIMFPLMLGLSAVAEPLIHVLLTEKWLFAVPYMQLFCIFYLFQPMHTANMQAIKAIGRSDTFFQLEIIKKSIEVIVLFAVMERGVMAIAISATALNILFIFVNSFPNKKLLNYSIGEQLRDVFSNAIMGIIMVIAVQFMGRIPLSSVPLMIIQIITGVTVYLGLSVILKKKEFMHIVGMLTFLKNKNH